MSATERIPLFPLEVVLFPGMVLPLHIFEPRYKLMIRRCLEEQTAFGVVLARAGSVVSVGCTAVVARLVREYPDGRMDILTAGQSVFRIIEVLEEKPFLEGRIEFLADEQSSVPPPPVDELLRLDRECRALLKDHSASLPDPEAQVLLSYQILATLPLELEFKQEMLELQSEAERQQRLLEHLRDWLPQLSRADRVRRSAGGNGHGLRHN